MSSDKSKADLIAERQANLPLPDQPPVASDFNSADARTVNVGSGGTAAEISAGGGGSTLREPASGASDVRVASGDEGGKTHTAGSEVGRTAKDGLGGLPNDAVTREARGKTGTEETRQPDYGYPHKSDPSSASK